ncbi:acyl-ACP thioesterase [Tanacetum coccineum]
MAVTGKHPNGVTVGLMESAENERVQLERLRDDGSSYKERFTIRCYEVGFNKTATIETIADLLQGRSCVDALVGHDPPMKICNNVLYFTSVYIRGNGVTAKGVRRGRIGIKRDWIIKDFANGEFLGRATSKWVMMSVDTRRLQKVSDDVINEYLASCPKALRLAFPVDNNNSLKKIAKLEDPAAYSRLGLMPRRADIDMNKHVNNVTHIGWALESVPQEVVDTHELQSITLDFKRECQHDDIVDSLTSPEPLNVASNGSISFKQDGKNLSRFLHLLRSSSDGLEKTRCRTEWRKLPYQHIDTRISETLVEKKEGHDDRKVVAVKDQHGVVRSVGKDNGGSGYGDGSRSGGGKGPGYGGGSGGGGGRCFCGGLVSEVVIVVEAEVVLAVKRQWTGKDMVVMKVSW